MDGPTRQHGRSCALIDAHRYRAAIAKLVPWTVSLAAHACVFGGLALLVTAARPAPQTTGAMVPEAYLAQPPAVLTANSPSLEQDHGDAPFNAGESVAPDPTLRYVAQRAEHALQLDPQATGVPVTRPFGCEPALSPIGSDTGDGSLPKCWFFGVGETAGQVVYVVDRSGSMIDTFDQVRYQLLLSIGRLKPVQQFHVILFGQDEPLEMPPGRLVAASKDNKLAAVRFLRGIEPRGATRALPALQRAFDVLGAASGPGAAGRLIYLLTDGEFDGPDAVSDAYTDARGRRLHGNAAVLAWLRRHNADRAIRINTLLYGYDVERAGGVMRRIARDSGGRFRFISLEDQ